MKLSLTHELDIRVVRQLTVGGPLTTAEIARALGCRESSVARTLKRLAAAEAVSSTPSHLVRNHRNVYQACPSAIAALVEQNLALLLAA